MEGGAEIRREAGLRLDSVGVVVQLICVLFSFFFFKMVRVRA